MTEMIWQRKDSWKLPVFSLKKKVELGKNLLRVELHTQLHGHIHTYLNTQAPH